MRKVKVRYCKFCGSLIDNETKICSGCGKKYFKIKFKKFFFKTIFFVLLILNIVIGFFYFDLSKENKQLSDKYEKTYELKEKYFKKYMDLENEKSGTEHLLTHLLEQDAKCREAINFINNHICIVTEHGYVYHTYDCYHWKNSDYILYWNGYAEKDGYRACDDCH